MVEIVNLRRFRKAARRSEAEVAAARNRTAFGQPQAGRRAQEAELRRAERALDAHRLTAEVVADTDQTWS